MLCLLARVFAGLSNIGAFGCGGGTLLEDEVVVVDKGLLLPHEVPGLLVEGDEHVLLIVGVLGALVQGLGGGGGADEEGECILLFFKGEPTTRSASNVCPKQKSFLVPSAVPDSFPEVSHCSTNFRTVSVPS